MQAQIQRKAIRRRIRHRIRKKVVGDGSRPRIAVFRSERHIYVQAIDDRSGKTLAQASTREAEIRAKHPKGWNVAAAKLVGSTIAERLKSTGVEAAVLDRGGFLYHGRVRALAEAAREAGLKI